MNHRKFPRRQSTRSLWYRWTIFIYLPGGSDIIYHSSLINHFRYSIENEPTIYKTTLQRAERNFPWIDSHRNFLFPFITMNRIYGTFCLNFASALGNTYTPAVCASMSTSNIINRPLLYYTCWLIKSNNASINMILKIIYKWIFLNFFFFLLKFNLTKSMSKFVLHCV